MLYDLKKEKERCIIIAICFGNEKETKASLDELEELINTTDALVIDRLVQNRDKADNTSYFGKGKLEELALLVQETNADAVVCDDELSKIQIRNIENILNVKVLDRTMIILDIFAKRASTSEGKIQVELAMLKYNATRLIGSRANLSDTGFGIGARGPGEKKLELDRRLIHDRISALKAQLKEIKKNRDNNRRSRLENSNFIISLVGYTNAGKSTLLNTLTGADAFAFDKLFATLDPITRKLKLDNGQEVLISDTVGFIRKLPHDLIEAFKSTLEEAKYSDLILHVVDSSNEDMQNHMLVVYDTLKKLSILDKDILTIYNKSDLVTEKNFPRDFHAIDSIAISAKNGSGIDKLKAKIEEIIKNRTIYIEKLFSYNNLSKIQEIRKYGNLLSEIYKEDGVFIKAYVPMKIYQHILE